MRHFIALGLFGIYSLSAPAYDGSELLGDCLAAETFYNQKATDPYQSIRTTRCLAYITGVADGYEIGNFLADKVGVTLNAWCLPQDGDLSYRMIRAVVAHLEKQPPGTTAPSRKLVASALARAFPCPETPAGR